MNFQVWWMKLMMCVLRKNSQISIELPKDFPDCSNKCILLTGAGYSNAFSGYLAKEIEAKILNHPSSTNSIQKAVLKPGGNYEEIFSELDENDKRKFQNLLIEIFKEMDLKQKGLNNKNNLERFISVFQKEDKYNFIITLNQDLLLERQIINLKGHIQSTNYTNEYKSESGTRDFFSAILKFHYPYINPNLHDILLSSPNKLLQNSDAYPFDDFNSVVKYESSQHPKKGYINYIKLHGSANWKHSEGNNILITGADKGKELTKYKLLQAQQSLVEKIFDVGKLKIVIAGYSFGDEHVNKLIKSSIKTHNSEIYIISTDSLNNFKNNKKIDKEILESVVKYYEEGLENFLNDHIKQKDFLSELKNQT